MRKQALALLLLLPAACAVRPNLGLIDTLTDEGGRREPFKPPYYARYTKGGKELLFIAAAHEYSLDSDTFKLVRGAFEKFKPKAVILEGFPTTEAPSPEGFSKHARRCWAGEGKGGGGCFEASYGAHLALERGTPFWGGEPDDTAILREMKSFGYTLEDLLSFYAFRQLLQLRRQGALKEDVRAQIDELVPSLEYDFETPKTGYDSSRFMAWHERVMGTGFDADRLRNNDVAPVDHEGATFIQRLNHKIGVVRERNLVSLEARLLNEYGRVLVVYGQGHLIKERRVLKSMLGAPKDEARTF